MDIPAKAFPLPEVKRQLDPYVKTRQEAHLIRRTLTAHLADQLQNEGSISSLHLAAGTTSLETIPDGVSGLRRDYMLALRDNVAAREQYAALVAQSRETISKQNMPTPAAPDEPLHDYTALLKRRQRHRRLEILQSHSKRLAEKAAADSIDQDPRMILKDLPAAPELSNIGSTSDDPADAHADFQGLLGRLEKAVLRAKHMHARESRRLDTLKYKDHIADRTTSQARSFSATAKVAALDRTRDELITWIESELSKAADSAENEKAEELHDQAEVPLNERLKKIDSQYMNYVAARATLLELLSAPEPAIPSAELGPEEKSDVKDSISDTTEFVNQVLPALERHLVPISNLRKSLIQQKSHLAACLAQRQEETSQTLQRLADESHLLPTYPLLAGREGFKNAVAALAPRHASTPSRVINGDSEKRDSLEKIRAWAFASNAARTATQEYVTERVEGGHRSLSDADQILSDIRIILGQSRGQGHQVVDPQEREDDEIRAASDAQGHRQLDRTDALSASTAPKHVWRGIGAIEVELD
jgi:hypothetical protein